jgi:hypothetical protein
MESGAQRRGFAFFAPVLVVALLLVAGCGRKKVDPATAARTFLEQVSRGDTAGAYKSTAFGFQSLENERAFSSTARELGLIGGKVVSITADDADEKTAHLNAIVTAATGESRTFILTMQVEAGGWRLFSIRERNLKTGTSENRFSLVGKTPMFAESMTREMPSDRELRRLVRGSMLAFADAIKEKSFQSFYLYISRAWRSQVTEKRLNDAFHGFIDQHVNLGGAAEVEPIIDPPPQMTSDGLLLVSGHYPTKPYEVYFGFKYIYELPEWKLFGLDVYLRKAGAPANATPSPAGDATPVPQPAK